MIFPRLVYKDGGPHERAGGKYDYKLVTNDQEYSTMLEDGWFGNLGEALQPWEIESMPLDPVPDVVEVALELEDLAHKEDDVEEDSTPPTREELDAKAKELGIKTYWKMSYETLLEKVNHLAGK